MTTLAGIEATVVQALRRWRIPGITVGVYCNGQTECRAWGIADPATGRELQIDDLFQVASITKPFTASTALKLVQQGKLDLDAPVTDRLPAAIGSAAPGLREITLRQLLSHSCGLDCELPIPLASYGDDDGATLRMLADYVQLRQWFAPGELFSYSNAGYFLAGALIEQATGGPYADAVQDLVLTPAGMLSSTFARDAVPADRLVRGARIARQGAGELAAADSTLTDVSYPRVRLPSGGLLTTAPDLLRFAAALIEQRPPFDAALLDQILDRPVPAVGHARWGLGFGLWPTDRATVLEHGGSYDGFKTQLTIAPQQRFACVVLANGSTATGSLQSITEQLAARLAGLELGVRPQPVHPALQPHASALQPHAPAQTQPATGSLQALAGVYRQPEQRVTVSVNGDQLRLAVRTIEIATALRDDEPDLDARQIAPNVFEIVDGERAGSQFDFILHPDGTVRFLRFELRVMSPISGAAADAVIESLAAAALPALQSADPNQQRSGLAQVTRWVTALPLGPATPQAIAVGLAGPLRRGEQLDLLLELWDELNDVTAADPVLRGSFGRFFELRRLRTLIDAGRSPEVIEPLRSWLTAEVQGANRAADVLDAVAAGALAARKLGDENLELQFLEAFDRLGERIAAALSAIRLGTRRAVLLAAADQADAAVAASRTLANRYAANADQTVQLMLARGRREIAEALLDAGATSAALSLYTELLDSWRGGQPTVGRLRLPLRLLLMTLNGQARAALAERQLVLVLEAVRQLALVLVQALDDGDRTQTRVMLAQILGQLMLAGEPETALQAAELISVALSSPHDDDERLALGGVQAARVWLLLELGREQEAQTLLADSSPMGADLVAFGELAEASADPEDVAIAAMVKLARMVKDAPAGEPRALTVKRWLQALKDANADETTP